MMTAYALPARARAIDRPMASSGRCSISHLPTTWVCPPQRRRCEAWRLAGRRFEPVSPSDCVSEDQSAIRVDGRVGQDIARWAGRNVEHVSYEYLLCTYPAGFEKRVSSPSMFQNKLKHLPVAVDD